MASEEEKVGTFAEFTRDVLPRIAELGYNAVQLMAVMEHPYYGSFGYHVSNFFAVSLALRHAGRTEGLIDTRPRPGAARAAGYGAQPCREEHAGGAELFDGTDHQYFHAGPRGQHLAWDSLLFDYSKYEVQRFLLSNVRYWLEEFRFDGFRFDGVTSMIYCDHGLGKAFTSYDDYFGGNIDEMPSSICKMANRTRPHDSAGMRSRSRRMSPDGRHGPAGRGRRAGI